MSSQISTVGTFHLALRGGHVLIIGGIKGIGRLIVRAFLTERINVSYCARTATGKDFDEFINSLYSNDTCPNPKAVATAVDISEPLQIINWVHKSAKKFAFPLVAESGIEEWEHSFRADLLGLITFIDAAVPQLEKTATKTNNATVVVISSLAGDEVRHPTPGTPYSPFKHAQAISAKDIATQLASKGIRINTIVPGSIEDPGIIGPDVINELRNYELVKQHK